MLTFTLIIVILLGLCYLMFREKTFTDRRVTSLIIVGVGTLILYTVASGFISKQYPLKRVTNEVIALNALITHLRDTTYITASIGWADDKVYVNKQSYPLEDISIKFLSQGDTVPRQIITQEERQIESSLWVVDWGLPYVNRKRTLYVPSDSVNIEMVKIIFESTLKEETDEETI